MKMLIAFFHHGSTEQKGSYNFLRFAGSANLSKACAEAGLQTGVPVDAKYNHDLFTAAGQASVWEVIENRNLMLSIWKFPAHHGQTYRISILESMSKKSEDYLFLC